jgi:hypothetical protein
MFMKSYWKPSEEWLCGGSARLLFGAAAILIIAVTAALLWVVPALPENPGVLARFGMGILGVGGGLSIFFLWGGMRDYWTRCDSSSQWLRRLSFLLLLVGFCYGAIIYYLCVYLPKTAPKTGRPLHTSTESGSTGPRKIRPMTIFKSIVIAGWLGLGFLGASVFLQLTSPLEFIARHHGAVLIPLYMIAVLVATALYKIIATYKAGMARNRKRV